MLTNLLLSQCVCNSFTKTNPVPTATPTVAPVSSPAPFGENRVDDEGLGNAILPPLKDSCQAFNPDSIYYKEPHPYQSFSEIFDTCAAGDECPDGTCCTLGWCLCMAIQDENHCLPGYSLYAH